MTDNTNETPNEQPPAAGTAPGNQAGDRTTPERTFTQAELDALIRDRLAKQEASLLKKLGVTSLDDARTAITKIGEIENAQKTEAQKLQEQLDAAKQTAQQADARRKAALIRAAVIAEASKPGMVAGDRIEAAFKLLDATRLTVNDDDSVSGVADALVALLDANPFLKGDEQRPGSRLGATNPAGTGEASDVTSWHPLSQSRATGGFAGRIIAPPSSKGKDK